MDTRFWWAGGSASESAQPNRVARRVPPYHRVARRVPPVHCVARRVPPYHDGAELCRVGPGEPNASAPGKHVPSRRPTGMRFPQRAARIPEKRVRRFCSTMDTRFWWAGGSASESAQPNRVARLVPPDHRIARPVPRYQEGAEQNCPRPLFPRIMQGYLGDFPWIP